MELIRNLHNILPRHHGCVLTIGNFDGVHRGHQQIIEHLHQQGERLNLPTLLATFEPLPQEFFGKKFARLTRLREKLQLFKSFQLDRVLVLRFDHALANLSAEDFVKQIIVDALGARYVVVGDDFQFGYQRQGDVKLLSNLGKKYDYAVETLGAVSYQGQRISSSLIRSALAQDDFARANAMCGYAYSMAGRVVHGAKLGRQWGVPTANIFLHRRVSPLLGIYVVLLHGIGTTPLQGVASLGYRPTLADDNKIVLEVHLFNFNQDIYGRHVRVEFLKKLRDEEKFTSIEELKKQIFCDIQQAQDYFVNTEPRP